MEKSSLRFAIIGCGRIAQRHAEHINEKATLVAVCDIDPFRADVLANQYRAKAYYDVLDMLVDRSDFDIVSICSPNGLHAEHSILMSNNGKHVLCEKPMALTVADCGNMIQAAEKNNKRLFIVKQNRYNPPVLAVKNLIDNGKLGKINTIQLSCFWNRNEEYYSNSWKGTKKLDGGILFTQFSHFIDLLYWLIGDAAEVKVMLDNFEHQNCIEFEDAGVAIIRFSSGAIGTINFNINSYEKNMEGSLTIFSEKGTIKIGGQYLNELEYQQIDGVIIENLPAGNKPNNYGTYLGSMSNHNLVYDNVIKVLENGASITTSAFEGLKTVEIIQKIYDAASK